jgi:hypothetical protein
MKVGDIVKFKGDAGVTRPIKKGIVIELFEKKCWRTGELGPHIDWKKVDPEPHAKVMISNNIISMPLAHIELVTDSKR